MAAENFLLNFDINLAPVEAKFQSFVQKARSAGNEIANLPTPKLPAFNFSQPQSIQQAGQQAGVARAALQQSGSIEGLSKTQLKSVQDSLRDQVKATDIGGLSEAQQAEFKAAADQTAAAVRKRLRGIENLALLEVELAKITQEELGLAAKSVAAKATTVAAPAKVVDPVDTQADAAVTKAKNDEVVASRANTAATAKDTESKLETARQNEIARQQTREQLAADEGVTAAKQNAVRATQLQTASITESLASDKEFQAQKLNAAKAQAAVNAETRKAAATDAEVVAKRQETAVAIGLQNASIRKGVAQDESITVAKAETIVATQTQAADARKLAATDETLTATKAESIAATQAQNAAARAAAAADEQTTIAKAESAVAEKTRTARIGAAVSSDTSVLDAEVAAVKADQLKVARVNLAKQAELAGTAIPAQVLAQTSLTEATKAAAQFEGINAANKAAIRNASKAEVAAKLKAAELASGSNSLSLQSQANKAAELAVEKQIVRDLQYKLQIEKASSREALTARAEKIISEKALTAQYRKDLAAQVKASGGNLFQVSRARFGLEGPDVPGGGGGGGRGGQGFFAGGALTSLKYSLPSLALFAGGSLLAESLTEAEELERLLLQLESQLSATVGPTQAVAEFERLSNAIKQTARDTGLAGDEVASFAIQLQGAFGAGTGRELAGLSGGDLVESQLNTGAKFARLSGLDDSVVFDDFSAAAIAFEESFDRIADVALSAQDSVGVSADEIANFLGKIAPVAKDAGFSLEEFAAIAAASQQASGASGDVLAEQFGRIIPAVTGARSELSLLATQNEALNQQPFLEAVATNDVAGILTFLIENFKDLDKAAQESVISLLGSRREAGALISVLENPDTFTRALDGASVSAGRLEERFAAFSGTFKQQLAVLGESFKQLILALLDAGLSDLISQLLDVLIFAVDAVRQLADAFGSLATPLAPVLDLLREGNDILDGWPVKIGLIAAALATVQGGSLLGVLGSVGTVTAATGGQVAGISAAAGATGGSGLLGGLAGAGATAGATTAAGAAALAGASVVVAIGSVIAAYKIIGAELDKNAQQVADLHNTLGESSDAELDFIIENYGFNFGERAIAALSGQKSPADVAEAIKADRARTFDLVDALAAEDEGFGDLIDAISSDDLTRNLEDVFTDMVKANYPTPGELQELNETLGGNVIKSFELDASGNVFSLDLNEDAFKNPELIAWLNQQADADNPMAQFLLSVFEGALNQEPIADAVEEAVVARNSSIDRAVATLDTSTESLDQVKARFDTGDGSITDLRDSFATVIASYENLIAISEANGEEVRAEDLIALNEAETEWAKYISKSLIDRVEYQNKIISTREGDTESSLQSKIDNYVGLLNNPEFSNPAERLKAAESIVSINAALGKAAYDALEDGVEKAALAANGVAVPQEAQVEILLSQLDQNNEDFTAFTDKYVEFFGDTTDEFVRSIVEAYVEGDEAIQQVKADVAARQQRAADALQRALTTKGVSLSGIVSATNEVANANTAAGAVDDALSVVSGAQALPTTSVGAGDAAKAAEDAKKAAEAAAAERERAAQELADAQNAYLLALVSGDPIKAGQERVRQAQEAISKAKTEADRINGQIELLNSERALEDAFRDLGSAQTDLLIAQAEAAGRSGEAAQLGYEQALEKVRQAEADFASGAGGQAAVEQAKAEAVSAGARVRDQNLADQLKEYEYLYEIGDIGKQQLIQYLEQLKQIPDLTTDQIRDLDRKIKSLNDELGQDLQFNLPGSIKLPNLYETRRLDQTTSGSGLNGGGVGYQDNRVISVELVVNGNTDAAELVQMLDGYLGNDRSSVSVRRY